jgi:capsular polysaccharide biosynthesis protein
VAEQNQQPGLPADGTGPLPSNRKLWRQERGSQLFFNMREQWPRLMRIVATPQRLDALDRAVVTARTRNKPGSAATREAPQFITGAVHDAAGTLLPPFADLAERSRDTLNRHRDPPRLDEARLAQASDLAGTHLYGGELANHFGHFLMETMARAWAFPDRPAGAKILFHQDSPRLNLGTAARTLLGWLGVTPDDIILADRDYRVERLLVPASLCEIQHEASPAFQSAFRRVKEEALREAGAQTRPRRLYLSRRAIDRVKQAAIDAQAIPERKRNRMIRKLILNEEAAEALFRERGFTIVTPELLPLAEQVALWDGADVVAGVTGSALHGALFGRAGTTRVVSLNNRLSQNQVAIEELMGLPAAHIFCTSRDNAERSTELRLDVIARALDELGL